MGNVFKPFQQGSGNTGYLQRPPKETPGLYAQDGKGYGALVYAHYFLGSNDWLVTEYDPEEDLAFGWACLGGDRGNAELGYTSIAELDGIRVPVRITNADTGRSVVLPERVTVEYDADWEPLPLREAIELLDRRQGRTE